MPINRLNLKKEIIEEFSNFLTQLKEFFSASSMEELLTKLGGHVEQAHYKNKETFVKVIGMINEIIQKGANTNNQQSQIMELITTLRGLIVEYKQICLECDDMDGSQLSVLSEIYLEEYLFQASGIYIQKVIESTVLSKNQKVDIILIHTQYLLKNLIFSNFNAEINTVLLNEIDCVKKHANKYGLLWLKSICSRITRSLQSFSEFLSKKYQKEVMYLAKRLKVSYKSASVYAESAIRSHLIFQLDKAVNFVSNEVADELKMSPYVIISQGADTQGYVIEGDSIDDIMNSQHNKVIAIISKVEGDEELPSIISGLIIEHEIPQLSHLAIRARQANIFCACKRKDTQLEKQLKELKYAKITIVKGNIVAEKGKTEDIIKISTVPFVARVMPALMIAEHIKFITLKDITSQEQAGLKAFNASILENIGAQSGEFLTPKSILIPHGVLNKLVSTPEFYKYLKKIDGESEQYISNNYKKIFAEIEADLQLSINKYRPMLNEMIQTIINEFPSESMLAIRSSSNMEDLSKFAGAGLYDSEIGINLNEKDIFNSIMKVWLSLYSKRALISRKKYSFSNESASMAILIQQVIDSELSFVIHTKDPSLQSNHQVIEIALGLGETIASSNIAGYPFRFKYDDGNVIIEEVASYSYKYTLDGKKLVDMTEYHILQQYKYLEEAVKYMHN